MHATDPRTPPTVFLAMMAGFLGALADLGDTVTLDAACARKLAKELEGVARTEEQQHADLVGLRFRLDPRAPIMLKYHAPDVAAPAAGPAPLSFAERIHALLWALPDAEVDRAIGAYQLHREREDQLLAFRRTLSVSLVAQARKEEAASNAA